MTDETRFAPTDPIAPGEPLRPTGPAASFSGRTPRKIEAVRAGVILGTGLVVALGAAVAMGASPSASPGAGAPAQTVPGDGNGSGVGGPGFGVWPVRPDAGGKGFGPGGPGRKDGRGFGQVSVTAIDGSSVTLATDDGWTRTIAVTSTTAITKGGADATLTDFAVGDTIRFAQTRNADGAYGITAIEIVQPTVAGTVTAVAAGSITITLRDGTSQTIATTGSTAYHVGRAEGTRADVTVGTTIVATGEKAADGSLTASSVWVHLPHVAGTVTGTTADTITLSRRDGTTVTIHVGSGTSIRVAGVEDATLSDVKTGMVIVVEGRQRADGSIDATAIGTGDGKLRGRDGRDGRKDGQPDVTPSPSASATTDG